MIEKRDAFRYLLLGLITMTLISILIILRGPITGYAIYQDSVENDFNEGTYTNTEFNNTGIMLKYWSSSDLEMPDNKADDWINMTGNVLLMHMNEESGTIEDTSGENNDGVNNGVNYGVTGVLNTALDFEGTTNDYITISMTRASETYTVGMWIYFKESRTGYLFDARQGGGEGYCYQNALNLVKSSGTIYIDGVASSTITLNEWHYVVVKDITLSIPSDLKIGRLGVSSSAYINSKIDEIAIWNRSLSVEEILEIYQSQKANAGYGGGSSGTYTSQIFDAGNDAVWNNLSWVGSEPNLENLFCVDGGGDVYKSIDLGENWVLSQENFGRTTATEYMFSNNNYLYILSTTGNEIWNSSNGTGFVVVYNEFVSSPLVGDSDNNGNLYVATGPGEVWKSDDNGLTWTLKGDFNPGIQDPKGISIDSEGYIYTVDGTGDIYKSTNDGVDWTKVNDGYGGSTGTDGMDEDSNDNLYILINYDFYKSSDSGVTWEIINDSITPYANILVKILIDDNDNFFILDAVGRVFKSNDYGINWIEVGDCNNDASNSPAGITNLIQSTDSSFQVRSCDDSSCNGENWVDVSNPLNLGLSNNQYFQYKVNFTSPDSSVTSSLESMDIDYDLVNTPPTITLASPQNGASYGYNESLSLNFTATDADDNINSCWYNLNNQNNITLTNCANTTIDVPEGENLLTIYVNDSEGEQASDSATFNIQVGAPTIVLNSPIDSYLNYQENIEFNYTPTDIDLDGCEFWGNFDGEFKLNQTDDSPESGEVNNFYLDLSDGAYLWNIKCTDEQSNEAFNGNKTFYVDTINPKISITEPTGEKTSRTSIPLTFTASDNNINTCWYNVYRGDSLEVANTSIDCSQTTSFSVTVNADFVLNLFVNDSAGNNNKTNSSFSVDSSTTVIIPPSGDSSSGGGGGGSYILPNKTGKIEVTKINNIISKQGDKKTISLNAKNIGKVFLNNCKLLVTGTISSWIYSDEIKGIAPGENTDFMFNINVPEEIDSGELTGELELKCDEVNDKQEISISILGRLDFIKINEVKNGEEGLKVLYTIDNTNLIGEKISIEIWILDEEGNEVKRIIDDVEINTQGMIERDVLIELPKNLVGIYSIYFAVSSDLDSFVKQSVVLGKSSTTGMAIFDTTKGKTLSYAVFILIISVGIFFIIKGHEKKIHKKKNHWLLRKKKKK